MERAIKDLCQLGTPALIHQAATGIRHILEVVDRLDGAAQKLAAASRHHAEGILSNLAAEEAAKVLILIDAVRCPGNESTRKSRTLGYFYDHLAKGIYAEVCKWKPVDFAEIVRGVELERVEHYLDGPNGIDWIFPNRIMQRRVDDLYVGYVRDDSDEAAQRAHYWTVPGNEDLFGYSTPAIVKLVRALRDVGATAPSGLNAISKLWSVVRVEPDMRIHELEELNGQTLRVMVEDDLVTKTNCDACDVVQYRWPFPLWPLDLRLEKVERKQLRDARRCWEPGGETV